MSTRRTTKIIEKDDDEERIRADLKVLVMERGNERMVMVGRQIWR